MCDYCSIIYAGCLSQYIWGILKSKLPYVIKAEGIAKIGRFLIDKSQQHTEAEQHTKAESWHITKNQHVLPGVSCLSQHFRGSLGKSSKVSVTGSWFCKDFFILSTQDGVLSVDIPNPLTLVLSDNGQRKVQGNRILHPVCAKCWVITEGTPLVVLPIVKRPQTWW